jgi:type I restriction enzyme S subunit
MEVKSGYKQSEIGVLPDEWHVSPLGGVVMFLDGLRRPVKDTDRAKMRGNIPYYGASGVVDYVNSHIFDEDLILLGEDGENIVSRNTRLAFRISGKSWVNNHAHVLRPNPGMHIGYLVEYLESLNYERFNTGTAQPKLNRQTCDLIPIACPPEREQQAIAQVLSDIDDLIQSLERLIAKKRDLKQAAMQQLLTGQTRLPGFSGEWGSQLLGDLVEILPSGIYGLEHGGAGLSAMPVATTAHISDDDRWNEKRMQPRYFTPDQITRYAVKKDDLIVVKSSGSAASIKSGKIGLVGGNEDGVFVFSNFLMLLRPRGIGSSFLYFYLTSHNVKKLLPSLVEASTYPNIRINEYLALAIPVPLLAEQTAIAAVLSDMDAEITALEARLAKTRDLKQGMMQELLTGRTRLV